MILSGRDTGVGVWARGLIGALGRCGGAHEYLVYHGRDVRELPALTSGNGRYVAVPIGNARRAQRILYEQLLLPSRLLRDGVDVLHCPAYVRPVRSRIPTVITLHDLFALSHARLCKRLNVLHFRALLPPSIRGATLIHCTSEWTRGELARLFPGQERKAHVITPAVDDLFVPCDDADADRAVLARLGLSEPPFLFVGNVEPKKNVGALLAAFAECRGRLRPARKLLIVGGTGWHNRDIFDTIRRLDLDEYVVQAGYVPRKELPGIYRASLALVFPSLVEGFGLPPLEAMACGVPVICSGGSGLTESVGDAARIVAAGDVPALARAMEEVADSAALRADLIGRGLNRAGRFCWPERVGQFTELYHRAVSA